MTDPYTILGLQKTADLRAVRTSYRRLSKTCHPDIGGDTEQFSRLGWAHTVLSDQERRAFWDRNGFDRGAASDLEQAAVSVLATLLQQVLTGDGDPTTTNLVLELQSHLRREIAGARENLGKLSRASSRVDILRKRFRRRGEGQRGHAHQGSLIDNILSSQQEQLSRVRHASEQQVASRERAIELLSEYDFDWTRVQQRAYTGSASTGTVPNMYIRV